ncbi:MAG: Rrf2 family transcriptional regulator [Chitinophagaceae bacterium]|nr:Rrf2 family transcriptional regulator [Chitinophagaceae bacterium]
MLSLTCKTAIKAVIYLATKSKTGKKSGIIEISDFINASEHTVGKILQTLVKENIINSAKGPTGGFYISAKQKNQAMIKIINAIDGQKAFDECGLGLSKCSATHPCPIHTDYQVIKNQFKTMCQQKKIDDLCNTVSQGLAYLMG